MLGGFRRLAGLHVEIQAETGRFDSQIAGVRTRLTGLATHAEDAGRRIGTSFSGLAAQGGLAAGTAAFVGFSAAMKASVETAIDIETRVVKLGLAANVSGAALQKMKKEMFDLATSMKGVKLEDVFTIATDIGKSGVPTDQIKRAAELVSMAAVAMDDVPAKELAGSLGAVVNVMNLGVEGFGRLASASDRLADSGNSANGDILAFTARVSGAAQVAKISAPELMALGTALMDTKTGAEDAASSISFLIGSLNNTRGRETIAKTLGYDMATLANLIETRPTAVLVAFLEKVKGLNAMGQQRVFKEMGTDGIEMANNLIKLAQSTDNIRKYTAAANEEFKTQNQLNETFKTQSATTESALKSLDTAFQISSDNMMTRWIPAIKTATDFLSKFIVKASETPGFEAGWLGALVPAMQQVGDMTGTSKPVGDAARGAGSWLDRTFGKGIGRALFGDTSAATPLWSPPPGMGGVVPKTTGASDALPPPDRSRLVENMSPKKFALGSIGMGISGAGFADSLAMQKWTEEAVGRGLKIGSTIQAAADYGQRLRALAGRGAGAALGRVGAAMGGEDEVKDRDIDRIGGRHDALGNAARIQQSIFDKNKDDAKTTATATRETADSMKIVIAGIKDLTKEVVKKGVGEVGAVFQ
jgi:TP901 family phage tail tape measure protein